MFDVGIDVGSVSINCVVIDEQGNIVKEYPYLRHFGRFLDEVQKIIATVYEDFSREEIRSVSITGNHGKVISEKLGIPYEFDSITQVIGACHLVPGVRTIISMGGQDACLFKVAYHDGDWELESFTMNGPCAAGTGSFIDQQAERLSSSIYGEEIDFSYDHIEKTLKDFIELGMKSKDPAPVACRCTVFTKSDMIHLQNKGESLENIIAGLHYGNAANYISTIVSNQKLEKPIIFIGGVASNALQVRAFRHYYPELIVPEHHTSVGAFGVALHAQKSGWKCRPSLAKMAEVGDSAEEFPRAPALRLEKTKFTISKELKPVKKAYDPPITAYLGIDIGSTTTKYALIDDHGKIIHKQYVQTQGKPIEVTQKLLRILNEEIDGWVNIRGVATTGSGRNVVGDFVNADLIIDEITAHARGAVEIDPAVDTVFEIGGQDSKYIRIQNTYPFDFDMNKVCAAGTGSFLHELANKLKINIVGEFQEIALSSQNPISLAERCTVFMESDLVSYAQKGAKINDLIAGLCYAIVHNYLNRVVGKRKIGQKIMFLGGPSLNKGIVAAFEKVLNRELIVPPNREVMGAYGAALAVREKQLQAGILTSKSHSLDKLINMEVSYTEKICHADPRCHNECKLKIYRFGDRKSIWGGDCGRYEMAQASGPKTKNFFKVREEIFEEYLLENAEQLSDLAEPPLSPEPNTIGIPLALPFWEWGILWANFFAELGYRVLISPKTNNRLARLGIESMTAETCFPVKVFHGHVKFLSRYANYLFLPNMINMPTLLEKESGFFCPLVQSSQYLVKAALKLDERRIVNPTVYLKDEFPALVRQIHDGIFPTLGTKRKKVEAALERSLEKQEQFTSRLRKIGREFLESESGEDPIWVISGRPYNLYDERLNLRLGRHLSKLGIKAIPLDFLDLSDVDLSDFPNMYWGLGAKILRTAKLAKATSHFYGVHLTNFSCGADSFIEHFYNHVMDGKPYLLLELDEHSAVAGMMTRVEAFNNVVQNVHQKHAHKPMLKAI